MLKRLIKTIALLFFILDLQAQSETTEQKDNLGLFQVPGSYMGAVSSQAGRLEQRLNKKTNKAVRQMMKQETRIIKKISRIDSFAANNILNTAKERYRQLEQRLKAPGKLTQYLPRLDTLSTSLKFIALNPRLLSSVKDGKEKLDGALSRINGLENELRKAEELKSFLRERRQYLKDQLSQLGLTRDLKKINKQAYYYGQQVNEYREMLKDSKKAEKKVLQLLSNTKFFGDFMKSNSMLASFFPSPAGTMPGQSLQGPAFAALQTRMQVTNFLQQVIPNGPNPLSRFQQNIQNAESTIDQLRNKIAAAGGNVNDLDMPNFKPNSQKTKPFFQRLEYGTSFQSQRSTSFFPTTSDIGLSVGYKLNDKSVVGIGAFYKVGWGNNWNNISVSNQGIGLRSFVDWKIKGSFWLSGGYERNYKTLFKSIEELKDFNAWQQSGLLGLSKIVSLKSKLFRKTKLQLLWDFLSYQQKPVTPPLLFRVGYNF